MSHESDIREKARALGVHRVGIARAGELPDDFARYLEFVDEGKQGTMGYLAEHREARRDTTSELILAGARSVIVCALAYNREDHRADKGAPQGPKGATIARYARGRDYHNFFRKTLRKLAEYVRTLEPGVEARALVDTAPVLERAWAQRAGVGFVGKNGCVIVPGLGSYVLLGEVITTLELAPDAPQHSRCGSCTLCLEACPTDAFDAPFVLDPRRCVSYLTIESREPIPLALRPGLGERLFGCDACLDVCPYNRTAAPPSDSTEAFALDGRWAQLDVSDIARLDDARFRTLTQGSPLGRPGRAGLARNAVVVMGNSGDRRYLPVLREVSEHDEDAMVREAASWAIDAIERKP